MNDDALGQTLVFAWLAGLKDLHHENIIWVNGKPFLIDADNALNFTEMKRPSVQAGFTKYENASEEKEKRKKVREAALPAATRVRLEQVADPFVEKAVNTPWTS